MERAVKSPKLIKLRKYYCSKNHPCWKMITKILQKFWLNIQINLWIKIENLCYFCNFIFTFCLSKIFLYRIETFKVNALQNVKMFQYLRALSQIRFSEKIVQIIRNLILKKKIIFFARTLYLNWSNHLKTEYCNFFNERVQISRRFIRGKL